MTFYTDLRDDTVAPLIDEFGQSGIYRVYAAETYDNETGKTTQGTPTDTAVKLLDLPIKTSVRSKAREFSEEVLASTNAVFLLEAKNLAAADVTPAVDNFVVVGGNEYRILAINPVAPAGVALVYKMAVQ